MKIVLVEISTSHEECLYSQLKFLNNSDFEVDLVLHEQLKPITDFYDPIYNALHFVKPIEKGCFKRLFQSLRLLRRLKQYDLVIFNTASSSKIIRNLALLLNFYKNAGAGVLHDTKRLQKSFTQKLISTKVKCYLVLNDHLLAASELPEKFLVQSFYPIFFPKVEHNPQKPNNTLWISIPGRIDYGRRNYDLLLECLATNPPLTNIKFLLLGKLNNASIEGKKLLESIQNKGLEHYFKIFPNFISNTEYHSYLMQSDYIMPLLTEKEAYLRNKISGSFNMAFAYKKPLLCNSFFRSMPDLEENAFFFNKDGLYQVLKKISSNKLEKKPLYKREKWSFDTQRAKYLSFISTVMTKGKNGKK